MVISCACGFSSISVCSSIPVSRVAAREQVMGQHVGSAGKKHRPPTCQWSSAAASPARAFDADLPIFSIQSWPLDRRRFFCKRHAPTCRSPSFIGTLLLHQCVSSFDRLFLELSLHDLQYLRLDTYGVLTRLTRVNESKYLFEAGSLSRPARLSLAQQRRRPL